MSRIVIVILIYHRHKPMEHEISSAILRNTQWRKSQIFQTQANKKWQLLLTVWVQMLNSSSSPLGSMNEMALFTDSLQKRDTTTHHALLAPSQLLTAQPASRDCVAISPSSTGGSCATHLPLLPMTSLKKLNSMVWVRERTIPTERPPLVGEVGANFLRIEGATWSTQRISTALFSVF
jgi:hypothetical protein